MKPHESPRIRKKSIRGDSGESWPVWNRGIKCWVKTRAGRIKIRPDGSRSGSKLFANVISRLQKCISIRIFCWC